MKKLYISLLLIATLLSPAAAQIRYKTIDIPDVPGYKTLKCDFHIHTIYSDGNVTPDVRVLEALAEGLAAIALPITFMASLTRTMQTRWTAIPPLKKPKTMRPCSMY